VLSAQSQNSNIQNGVIKIKNSDLSTNNVIKLDGSWQFYWNKRYAPDSFKLHSLKPDAFVNVPGSWSCTTINGQRIPHTGCATYRLEIVADTNVNTVLYFKEIISAYAVWFNGEQVLRVGTVSDNAQAAVPKYQIGEAIVNLHKGSNELIVQISNFNHRSNSFEYAPLIGSLNAVNEFDFTNYAIDLIIIGFLIILILYHLRLIPLHFNVFSIVLFSLFCVLSIIRISVSNSSIISSIFPHISWHSIYFLRYFTLYTLFPVLGLFLQATFNEKRYAWAFNSSYIISALFVGSLFFSSLIYTELLAYFEIITIVYFSLLYCRLLIEYTKKHIEGALIFLISSLLLALASINDTLFFLKILPFGELMPFGIFVLAVCQGIALGYKFTSLYAKNEHLSVQLDYQNRNLKTIVEERTKDLEAEKQKLKESNRELRKYFTAIEQSHATIVITDTQGNIEYTNPQFEITTGYTVAEAMGKNPRILKSGKTTALEYQKLWETIAGGRVWSGEFYNRTKNGNEYIERASISPIKNELGEIINYIAVKEDITKLKYIQQALIESEEKYRLIAENTSDVIWKIDLATLRFSYVSPSVLLMRGYTAEEVMNAPLQDSLSAESLAEAQKDVTEYLKRAQTTPNLNVCRRYRQPCKNGQLIDVEIAATFIRNKNGQPVEILGTTRDISKRVKVEQALAESEAQLAQMLEKQTKHSANLSTQINSIFNNSFSAIAFFKVDNQNITFSSCNKRWAQSLGYIPEELEGANITTFCDNETIAIYQKYIRQAIESQKPVYEYINWRNLYLYTCVIPIYDEFTNKLKYCGSIIYNVTDKFQAELKMHESEEKFRNIFNHSRDAIILLDCSFNVVDVNNEVYNLLGQKTEPTYNVFQQFIPAKYHQKINDRFTKLQQGEKQSSFECELIRYDKTLVPVEFSSTLINFNNNKLILCIIRDISNRKNFERTLTQVGIQIENRERRKLAADLHDNVGPLLSSMNMCISLLSRKPNMQAHSADISDIRRILKEAISSVREISNNISPQVLTNYGLISALEMFFETKQKLINIHFNHNIGDLRLGETKEIMLYNIIKEVFNNTLKYAQASSVALIINKNENLITVFYQDNGIGFNLDEKLTSASTNLGLFSIINRVKNIEGDYEIKTSPNNGFLLKIIFPL
jgi:PAS domain S-box-containing protein